jgi:Tfp pilus assembly protein PilF
MSCLNEKSSNEHIEIDFHQKEISHQEFKNPEAKKENDIAVDMAKNGQNIDAEKIFQKALEIEPDNYTILSNIGLNSLALKKYDKSIEYLNKAITDSDSTYFMASSNLGLVYYKMTDYNNSIKILNYVINNCDDKKIISAAYINQALSYISIGNCTEAKNNLNLIKEIGLENDAEIKNIEEKLKNCVQHRL